MGKVKKIGKRTPKMWSTNAKQGNGVTNEKWKTIQGLQTDQVIASNFCKDTYRVSWLYTNLSTNLRLQDKTGDSKPIS